MYKRIKGRFRCTSDVGSVMSKNERRTSFRKRKIYWWQYKIDVNTTCLVTMCCLTLFSVSKSNFILPCQVSSCSVILSFLFLTKFHPVFLSKCTLDLSYQAFYSYLVSSCSVYHVSSCSVLPCILFLPSFILFSFQVQH